MTDPKPKSDASLIALLKKVVTEGQIAADQQNTINSEALRRGLEPEDISAVNRLTELIEKGKIEVQ